MTTTLAPPHPNPGSSPNPNPGSSPNPNPSSSPNPNPNPNPGSGLNPRPNPGLGPNPRPRPRLDVLSAAEVDAAAGRITGLVRPVSLAALAPGLVPTAPPDPLDDGPGGPCEVWLALELLQHTGSFQVRGALNFLRAHRTLPGAGVTATGDSATTAALAWAAHREGVPLTLFLPATAPTARPARLRGLRGLGARVHVGGSTEAEARSACARFAAATGALAYRPDHPLAAAGAGTLVGELRRQVPGLDTIVLAEGAEGLSTGIRAAARPHNIRTVTVALTPPDHLTPPDRSTAAGRPACVPASTVLVPEDRAARACRALWADQCVAVAPATAAALAALLHSDPPSRPEHRRPAARPTAGSYRPAAAEKVVVLLDRATARD
ncbi:pyridoxal-phosphate dependent enzyme [Streptacidiphilus cavernicola]|uniref:Pyridoxal-phosphate dependent enzyme n=1 Tax=Streptacidiphilus cavernicola TaxID=3342716 RepID=A0ABV6W5X8_9ACTN